MTAPIDPLAVAATVWDRQSVWSRAANEAKRRIGRSRTWALGLTIAAAVLGTASAQVAGHAGGVAKALAVAAAVALGLAPIVARTAGRDAVQVWTRLRSVSESLKADVYVYLAGVPPFHDPDDRAGVLLRRLDEHMADAEDLIGRTTSIDATRRDLPAVTGVPSYLTERLDAQLDGYYVPAARRMAARAKAIRLTTAILSGGAAVLTATVGVFGGSGLTEWIGVVTTVTTAVTGYGAAQRYEYQQVEFARTVDQLQRLRAARRSGQAYTDDGEFVTEVERVISISNEGWMAKVLKAEPA